MFDDRLDRESAGQLLIDIFCKLELRTILCFNSSQRAGLRDGASLGLAIWFFFFFFFGSTAKNQTKVGFWQKMPTASIQGVGPSKSWFWIQIHAWRGRIACPWSLHNCHRLGVRFMGTRGLSSSAWRKRVTFSQSCVCFHHPRYPRQRILCSHATFSWNWGAVGLSPTYLCWICRGVSIGPHCLIACALCDGQCVLFRCKPVSQDIVVAFTSNLVKVNWF